MGEIEGWGRGQLVGDKRAVRDSKLEIERGAGAATRKGGGREEATMGAVRDLKKLK